LANQLPSSFFAYTLAPKISYLISNANHFLPDYFSLYSSQTGKYFKLFPDLKKPNSLPISIQDAYLKKS